MSGSGSPKADVVSDALEAERRRRVAAEDLRILREQGPQDDLDELVVWSVSSAVVED